jgi:hypothetical protein
LQGGVPHTTRSSLGDGLLERFLQGQPVEECMQQLAMQFANQVSTVHLCEVVLCDLCLPFEPMFGPCW